MLKVPAFYHRSTIALVDDDALFLTTFKEMLSANNTILSFSHPADCAKFFDTYSSPLSKISFLNGCIDHDYFDTVDHSPVDFDVTKLYQLIKNDLLHNEITVLIADYNMPGINGIELLKNLKNFPIKKILLTAEANHRDAVLAFNENVIDRFVRKDSPSILQEINQYINSLTKQFYCEQTHPLLSHLEANHSLALSDPIFAKFFEEWLLKNSIQKFSLIDKNGSFLVVNKNNETSFFILHTDSSLEAFFNANRDVSADNNALIEIKNRKKIPFFGVGVESWQIESDAWHQYLYRPEIINGREKYYWSHVKREF